MTRVKLPLKVLNGPTRKFPSFAALMERQRQKNVEIRKKLEAQGVDTTHDLVPAHVYYCPLCVKETILIPYGRMVLLGRRKRLYYRTVCDHCETIRFLTGENGEPQTADELKQRYSTYFKNTWDQGLDTTKSRLDK